MTLPRRAVNCMPSNKRIPVIQAQIAACHEEVSTQKQRLASLKSYQQSLWGGKVVVPIGGAPEEVGGKAVMLMNAKEAYENLELLVSLNFLTAQQAEVLINYVANQDD